MKRHAIRSGPHSYLILLQPEPEGGYTVTCPTLPGLVTYGEGLEEARAMAADAIRGYLECLREDGEPIPESNAEAGLGVSTRRTARSIPLSSCP